MDFNHKELSLNGKQVILQIWDTAGQERFQSLGYSYYRGADCCALVFDLTNPDSFEKVAEWREVFLKNGDPNEPFTFPFIVIGNKCDIPDRKVQTIKAKHWCKNLSA